MHPYLVVYYCAVVDKTMREVKEDEHKNMSPKVLYYVDMVAVEPESCYTSLVHILQTLIKNVQQHN